MRAHIFPFLFVLGLIVAPLTGATPARPLSCEPELLTLSEKRDPEHSPRSLRTIKILTSGHHADSDGTIDPREPAIDTADPSAPFFLTLPNGKKVVRIYLSGLRYLQGATLEDLLKGGIQKVHKIRGFYADGTEMNGLYHEDSFPWDPELHVLDDGTMIGHGGVIPQVTPGTIPTVRNHNAARTRMWAKVEFVETKPGHFEERWHFQGSIFGHTPTFDRWLSSQHFHNYGATFFRWPDGRYVRDEQGNYTMLFEGVTEERLGKPWNTEVFAIKVDPTLTRTIGTPILIQSTRKGKTRSVHFKASERQRGTEGYLLEGGRPIAVKFNGRYRWIVAMSGGDYVTTRYGVHLSFNDSENPMSPYSPVLDSSGELIDFAHILRCLLHATWGPGRPSLFYDSFGRLWMAIHFISKHQIPDGEVKDGWPASPEEFIRRHRRTAVVPVKITFHRGQPNLILDASDADPKLKDAIRFCEGR